MMAADFWERQAEAQAYYESSMRRVRDTPAPEGQKYPPGARVRIADDLGPAMRHFPAGRGAKVQHTYAHAYGGKNVTSYSLDVDGCGGVAWYYESQLTPEQPNNREVRRG